MCSRTSNIVPSDVRFSKDFTTMDNYKLVCHCGTRWLSSLQSCVERFLQHWPALTAYFQSNNDAEKPGSRVAGFAQNLQDPLLALNFRFLAFILDPLNTFNTKFQVTRRSI
ncbi:hypothetical protein DPMN_051253 [Dreissena polymorpha]|uniref:Uncharacterized protein n=1 Tax=Dreissena polymorpha TaxID=45954 RepID=A0A9D4CJG0_DREPO|nr:hypothetical protein DPMN_051253 [Dreissena polymorpha]